MVLTETRFPSEMSSFMKDGKGKRRSVDGDTLADITYQFRFTTLVRNPEIFLYNTGQITALRRAVGATWAIYPRSPYPKWSDMSPP